MDAWVVWLIIAIGLGLAELSTRTLYLVSGAGAALVAMMAAAVGLGAPSQLAFFGVSTVLLVVFARPLGQHVLRRVPIMRSGAAALVGREALVLSEITRHAGRVRIGGEEWTARPYDSSLVIPEGATVEIFAIEGATALVHPQEELWAG